MTINDIWGQINVEPCYEKIINSKEFVSQKNKVQLGLNCNDNAIHTRYQHSLGVYYLACKLINLCKAKFSNILNITLEDEQAIKCMALVHDIGHGCFSHVSEKFLDGTHEDNTVNILLDENSEINNAIVSTFGNSRFVMGENNDFSSILNSMKLEYIDDDLEIVFDSDAEYKIANFFNKRFELYDTLYLDNKTRVMEAIFGKFLELTNNHLSWNTTEVEMNNLFR